MGVGDLLVLIIVDHNGVDGAVFPVYQILTAGNAAGKAVVLITLQIAHIVVVITGEGIQGGRATVHISLEYVIPGSQGPVGQILRLHKPEGEVHRTALLTGGGYLNEQGVGVAHFCDVYIVDLPAGHFHFLILLPVHQILGTEKYQRIVAPAGIIGGVELGFAGNYVHSIPVNKGEAEGMSLGKIGRGRIGTYMHKTQSRIAWQIVPAALQNFVSSKQRTADHLKAVQLIFPNQGSGLCNVALQCAHLTNLRVFGKSVRSHCNDLQYVKYFTFIIASRPGKSIQKGGDLPPFCP